MSRSLLLIFLMLVCVSCQKNSEPEEIVRVVPGKSLKEQIAPAMTRQQQGKGKIYLVQDSISADQLDKHIKENSRKNEPSKFQPLYISGQKAKTKKLQKEQMSKQIENKKAGK